MMLPEENELPRCRLVHKKDGRTYRCPNPVKYAGETRCEDCFVEAQLPQFWKTRTVRQEGGVRIVERVRILADNVEHPEQEQYGLDKSDLAKLNGRRP